MATYTVYVEWKVKNWFDVEADSLEEAQQEILNNVDPRDYEGEYVKDSFVVTEINTVERKIQNLLDNLAMAFGGHSQYSMEDIGAAIAGQINNNGWEDNVDDIVNTVIDVMDDKWGMESDWAKEDAERIRLTIESRLK